MVCCKGGGEGGLTPEEAQEMIDESISGKADTSAVTQALTEKVDVDTYDSYTATTDAAIASKADESDLSALESVVGTKASEADLQALESVVGGKLATSDFNTYSAATDSAIAAKASQTDLETVSGNVNTLSGDVANKVDTSAFTAYSASVDTAIASKADTTAMTQALSTKQDTLVSGTNIKTINNTSILGSGNIEIQVEVDDELDIDSPNAVANSAITKAIQDNELVVANALIALQEDLDDKVDVSAYTAYTSATDSAISTINTALSGYKLAKMTTAEYEALTVKDESTIYFIVD